MRTTLVVCESPWSNAKGLLERRSMHPFVEGLYELYGARLVYRTFTTQAEIKRLLGLEAIDDSDHRVIVYIACHGIGGRLTPSRVDESGINIGTLAESTAQGVEGFWLGACDVGSAKGLTKFLAGPGGAVWAGGYVCSVRWDTSLLLDLAVLQQLMSSGPIQDRKKVVSVVRRALRGFDPSWIVGDDDEGRPTALRAAIRLVARNQTRGGRPMDVSRELREVLRWEKTDRS